VGINPHSNNPPGATRIKGTKTPREVTKTNAKDGIRLKPFTLVLYVEYIVITLTIAHRSLISRG
jgi:hypothetical protein